MLKKKIISTILSLVMLTPMAANVQAEVTLTLDGFNATRTAITVDFAGLADGAVLTGGTATVTASIGGEKSTLENVTVTQSKDAVVIAPAEKLSTEALYKVDLSGVTDGTNTAADVSTGWFRVDEIFFDDFTVAYDEEGNLAAPYYANESTGKIYSSYWEMSNAFSFTDGALVTTREIAYASLLKGAAGLSDVTFDEYTVEADVTMPKYMEENFYVTLKSGYTDRTSYGSGYCFGIPSYDARTDWSTIEGVDVAATLAKNGMVQQTASCKVPKEYTGRYAVADGKAEWYMNDDKVLEYADTISGNLNVVTFRGRVYAGAGSWSIDNVSVTKCEKFGSELPQIAFGDYKVTTDSFMLDVNNALGEIEKAEELTALYKNGKELDATVTVQNSMIIVKAEEDFKAGEAYCVKVKAGVADDKGTTPAVAYEQYFTVNKLWEDSFDTDVLTAGTGYANAYVEYADTKDGNLTFKSIYDESLSEYADTYGTYNFGGTAWDRRFSINKNLAPVTDEIMVEFDYSYTGTPNNLTFGLRTIKGEVNYLYNNSIYLMPATGKVRVGSVTFSYPFESSKNYHLTAMAENAGETGTEYTSLTLIIDDGETETILVDEQSKGSAEYDESEQSVNMCFTINNNYGGSCQEFTVNIDNLTVASWKDFSKSLAMVDTVLTDFNEENVTVTAKLRDFENLDGTTHEVIAAAYDSNGRLLAVTSVLTPKSWTKERLQNYYSFL